MLPYVIPSPIPSPVNVKVAYWQVSIPNISQSGSCMPGVYMPYISTPVAPISSAVNCGNAQCMQELTQNSCAADTDTNRPPRFQDKPRPQPIQTRLESSQFLQKPTPIRISSSLSSSDVNEQSSAPSSAPVTQETLAAATFTQFFMENR